MFAMFTIRLSPEGILLVLLAAVALTSFAFLTVPKNTVAILGARVKLECSTSNPKLSLRWSYYASENWQRLRSLFNGQNLSNAFAPTYEVDVSAGSGRYNLIIKAAGFSQAGEYLCAKDPFNNVSAVAFLTVIASDPVCATNVSPRINGTVENDELWLQCKVTYIGKGIPLMIWTTDGNRNVAPNAVNSTLVVSTYTSEIKMLMNADANAMTISCKTLFQMPPPANETINYVYYWNYTANVLYGPRNLNITPLSNTSDSLLCSADGNPSPTYEWTDFETGILVVRGPVLNIAEAVNSSEKEYTFQCTAANVVAHQKISKSLNITFNVTDTVFHRNGASTDKIETEASSISTLLIIVVCPSVVASILILIIAVLLVSRACRRDNNRQSVSDNLEFANAVALAEYEDLPNSDVDVSVSAEPLEPYQRQIVGLPAKPGNVQGKVIAEPREKLYAELTTRQGRVQRNREKETYTQLSLIANASGATEYDEYIEVL